MVETANSEGLKAKMDRTQIPRWEDDGGAIFEPATSLLQTAKTNTPESMDVAGECFLILKNLQPYPVNIKNTTKRRILMNKKVGLWLNHTKAVIVSITNDGEERRIITSDMEHYVRYSSNVPGDGSAEDVRDRRFWNHLGEYYDKVIARIGDDAKSILIFGPGEAKYELKKRLENVGMLENIVSVDDAGSLTDRQIALRVRERFPARAYFNIF